ncbi:hypothetical protein CRG98_027844 [Punica granatum]|uniref:Uncharacterized protein n=1 Tax=Punica granatum TaxID=22663 RepID=A0A2I0J7Z0_PUNGR|nr:hypothetical protein CRG98_027844 [Punica granatum]
MTNNEIVCYNIVSDVDKNNAKWNYNDSFHTSYHSQTLALTLCFARALQLCRATSPVHISFIFHKSPESPHSCLAIVPGHLACTHFFHTSQIRRVTSLLPCNCAGPPRLCTFPSYFANLPSHLTRALQLCRTTSHVHISFILHKSAESPHSCLATVPSHLAFHSVCAPCILQNSTGPRPCTPQVHWVGTCEQMQFIRYALHIVKLHRASPVHPAIHSAMRPCILQLYRATSPVHISFYASQISRVTSLVLLATLPATSLVHISFYASQISRVTSLVLLATLPGHLACAHFLHTSQIRRVTSLVPCNCAEPPRMYTFPSYFTNPPSHLTRALQLCRATSHVHISFILHKSAESPHSCLATVPSHLACAHFLLCFANQPSHLTRASCNFTGPPRLCTFLFMLRKSAESPHSCFLQLYLATSPVHISFYASQINRVTSLVLLATLPGHLAYAHFLLCFANLPSHLTRTLQLCRTTTPLQTLFKTLQYCRAPSLVLLTNPSGLLAHSSLQTTGHASTVFYTTLFIKPRYFFTLNMYFVHTLSFAAKFAYVSLRFPFFCTSYDIPRTSKR